MEFLSLRGSIVKNQAMPGNAVVFHVVCLSLLLLFNVVYPPLTHGEVFRYVDDNGVLHLTDRKPAPNAKPLRSSASSSRKTYHAPRELKSKFNGYVDRICRDHEFDSQLVRAVIEIESAYNHLAISSKGAQGLMQIMPGTAQRFGVENPFDPYDNIECGVRYLKYLKRLFEGDVNLALAAYNCGENRVLQKGGIPQIEETVQYVKKVLNVYNRNKLHDSKSEKIVQYIDDKGTILLTNRPNSGKRK